MLNDSQSIVSTSDINMSSMIERRSIAQSTIQADSILYSEDMLEMNKDSRRKRLILLGIILLFAATISSVVAVACSTRKVSSSTSKAPTSSLPVEDIANAKIAPVNSDSKITTTNDTATTAPTSSQVFRAVSSTSNTSSNATDNVPVQPLSMPVVLPSITGSQVKSAQSTVSADTYSYKDTNFAWKDSINWEWADGSAMTDAASKFSSEGITVDTTIRKTPMRTRSGWNGEKVVYVAWTSNAASDTNIWMLNTKIKNQFAANNGWPYYGEIDIFEMFNNDAKLQSGYDFSGFKNFQAVNSYGQLTLHYSTSLNTQSNCFCPSSPSKTIWYDGQYGMTSACTAQFINTPNQRNEIALVFGSDSNGKYLQVIQYPVLTLGASNTYDVKIGANSKASGKIYNNKDLYWGSKITECNSAGQNPATGFPFFEDFRLILEEQSSGQFLINDIKILTKS